MQKDSEDCEPGNETRSGDSCGKRVGREWEGSGKGVGVGGGLEPTGGGEGGEC